MPVSVMGSGAGMSHLKMAQITRAMMVCISFLFGVFAFAIFFFLSYSVFSRYISD